MCITISVCYIYSNEYVVAYRFPVWIKLTTCQITIAYQFLMITLMTTIKKHNSSLTT